MTFVVGVSHLEMLDDDGKFIHTIADNPFSDDYDHRPNYKLYDDRDDSLINEGGVPSEHILGDNYSPMMRRLIAHDSSVPKRDY